MLIVMTLSSRLLHPPALNVPIQILSTDGKRKNPPDAFLEITPKAFSLGTELYYVLYPGKSSDRTKEIFESLEGIRGRRL